MADHGFGFYEFFSGGGMARLGLGAHWRCLFANDVCEKKARAYAANFPPADELVLKSVADVRLDEIPEDGVLAWASFPCQDLSLAGRGEGFDGERSSTFWPFWNLMRQASKMRGPVPLIVLENVAGALTSRKGRDFVELMRTLFDDGYLAGPMIVDAARFLPQSRPRLFIVAVHEEIGIPEGLRASEALRSWHPDRIRNAFEHFPPDMQDRWVWWNMPEPAVPKCSLADIIEDSPDGVEWHDAETTKRLLAMMSEANIEKVRRARRVGSRMVGTVYRRTRRRANGEKVQRAEVRFDQVSGCLRTPAGGSSRQILLFVEGRQTGSRLVSPRETARLMGVSDSYVLPERYNDAYHLMGDGLVVPVVSWIEEHLLRPLAVTVCETRPCPA